MTLIQQKTGWIDSIKGYSSTQYITIDYDPQSAVINLQLPQSAATPKRLTLTNGYGFIREYHGVYRSAIVQTKGYRSVVICS